MSITHNVSLGLLSASIAAAAGAQGSLPEFDATSLTGERVTERALIGQPTILVVTPSRDAAADTKAWGKALRKNVDASRVRVRDVLSIDLPFFMSERDALGRARDRIPKRYHDQTWLLGEPVLERALNVPRNSEYAYVFVLDEHGRIVSQTHGKATEHRIDRIVSAIERVLSESVARTGLDDE